VKRLGGAAVMAVALVAGACSNGRVAQPRATSPAGEVSPTPAATAVTSTLEERLEAEIHVDDQPDWLATKSGSVWVAIDEAGTIGRIDPSTNELVEQIRVGDHPCNGLVAEFGSLWAPACGDHKIYRVDPERGKVDAAIDVPFLAAAAGNPEAPQRIAGGEGGIWVVTKGKGGEYDTLSRIDPATNQIADTIELGRPAGAVEVGEGAVWVMVPTEGMILRVDPATNEVVAEIDGLAQPVVAAAGEGVLWVVSGTWSDHPAADGTVTRIDPATNEVVASIQVDERVGNAGDITIEGGTVWVRTQYTLLAKIDPQTNTVVDRITDLKGLGGVTVGFGSVWLSDFANNEVWRVTPTP
jgi:virginiamycin B lyase